MIGFFKRLLWKRSAVPFHPAHAVGLDAIRRIEEANARNGSATSIALMGLDEYHIRSKMIARGKEIHRLRRNKKKFSHLVAEQEADLAAIKSGVFS